jgi:lysophospholipase L1-like esterase
VCRIVVMLCISSAAACGSKAASPAGPSAPAAAAPQIVCGGDVSVIGRGPTQPAVFGAPTVSGGVSPVAFSCSPLSGSAFAVGATTVTCRVTDAAAQTASCTLTVRVSAPLMSVKKFQAVGDSLTLGENGLPIQVSFVDDPNSYPTKLRVLLDGAFPGQGITLSNHGVSGQFVNQTKDALSGYLAEQPEAVMLLAGYNNLTTPCHVPATINDAACDAAVENVEDVLRECLQIIRRASPVRYVFIGLLTPPGPVAANAARDLRIDSSAIQDLNNRIRNMASAEGAIVVDTFSAFVGHEAEFVSIDGLHLRPAGYQALADAFFAKILSTVPQTNPVLAR